MGSDRKLTKRSKKSTFESPAGITTAFNPIGRISRCVVWRHLTPATQRKIEQISRIAAEAAEDLAVAHREIDEILSGELQRLGLAPCGVGHFWLEEAPRLLVLLLRGAIGPWRSVEISHEHADL